MILPAVTEVESLRETIKLLLRTSAGDISELIFVVCDRTTPETLAACYEVQRSSGKKTIIHMQARPFLGNAIREAIPLATARHVVIMATDLETDPATFPDLVGEAKRRPEAVITASRWLRRRSFQGYGAVRVPLNYSFQFMARVLYGTSLSDLTFGYRLFPLALLQSINWEGQRHDFLLETILKPVRLQVPVIEVPTRWVPRTEGASQNSIKFQLEYVAMALRCRFAKPDRILRHPAPPAIGAARHVQR